MSEGGLNDANRILRDYHRQAVAEANKAREIEDDVITQLSGLRADLGQKIKEIKSLAGDFKNSVDKEREHTRRAVNGLQEALSIVDRDPNALVGKEDPYIIRLGVDRQIERQLDEENYLHRAYLNLEGSGRELESIVVGEVQKAYNALATIMKREADEAYNTVDALRSGPVTLPKDLEWRHFIDSDPHFISPDTPLRKIEDIQYPGKMHPAAAEVRAGMLERKSKYLKSYTPGWYVLSPTHLHEFKSADHIYSQSPVMSLLLADQKLGSHSQPGSSSHKFMLKGRQTGSMHRGHSWVFRAETYETMLAWYDDIRALTEKTGEERNAFVRKHARSFSAGSQHRPSSVSGDSALDEDEADEVPFSAMASAQDGGSSVERDGVVKSAEAGAQQPRKRPEPGGRFPSDLNINRHLQATLSHSSGSSSAGADQQQQRDSHGHGPGEQPRHDLGSLAGGPRPETADSTTATATYPTASTAYPMAAATVRREQAEPQPTYENTAAYQNTPTNLVTAPYVATSTASNVPIITGPAPPTSQDLSGEVNQPRMEGYPSGHANWVAPAAAGAVMGAGAVGAEEHWRTKREEAAQRQAEATAQNVGVADTGKSPGAAEPDSLSRSLLPLPVTTTAGAGVTEQALYSPASASGGGQSDTVMSVVSQSTAATELTESPTASQVALSHTAYDTARDGTVNATPTGKLFPAVLRHDTNTSISNLHVPGEYN
ncbi:hypothetical protein, variant [Verruconis gallopava]|nr:hypothetical protein, variant [Verruconis gallopava]KIW00876.1 hypothetical protein, variant [Verruconis gallopava]